MSRGVGGRCYTLLVDGVADCNRRSYRMKRDSAPHAERDVDDMEDLFEVADEDKSGTLDVEEYLSMVNFTESGTLTDVSVIISYIEGFYAHDTNGDGLLSLEEAH